MPEPTDRLHQLAEAAGLMVHWHDAHGRHHQVAAPVLQALLTALDLPADSPAAVDDSLARLADDASGAMAPTLLLGDVGVPTALPWLPRGGGARWTLTAEDGSRHDGTLTSGADGVAALPALDVWGVHRLEIDGRVQRIALAPSRCYGVSDAVAAHGGSARRLWGVAAQLYGLRGEPEPGVGEGPLRSSGDFGTLGRWCSAAGRRGAAAFALNPVHAAFAAAPERYSPYSPSNRQFLNVLYADPVGAFGRDAVERAIQRLQLGGLLERLALAPEIDWVGISTARLAVLRALHADRHALLDAAVLDELAAFRRDGGAPLLNHACFEVLHARHAIGDGAPWQRWPDDERTPDGDAVRRIATEAADEVDFHIFAQWLASRSLAAAQQAARDAGMPIGLIGDLAVGADPNGSHAWSRQAEIAGSLEVGAPPDIFMPSGQGWGLSAFSPRALRQSGYAAYIDMLEATMSRVGGVRIDHVLGLQRLWLIPAGASPANGAYLRYPFDDLVRLIKIASWRHRAIVVGENLGTVPEGFNDRIAAAGLLGTSVLWFERDGAAFRPPATWNDASMATTTTHDLPTVAGWWSETDIDWQVQLDLLPDADAEATQRTSRADDRAALATALAASTIHGTDPAFAPPQIDSRPAAASPSPVDAAIAYVCDTPAPLVMLPIEDLLGLAEQPNLPGTSSGHPNWCRRIPMTHHPVFDEPDVQRRIALAIQRRGTA